MTLEYFQREYRLLDHKRNYWTQLAQNPEPNTLASEQERVEQEAKFYNDAISKLMKQFDIEQRPTKYPSQEELHKMEEAEQTEDFAKGEASSKETRLKRDKPDHTFCLNTDTLSDEQSGICAIFECGLTEADHPLSVAHRCPFCGGIPKTKYMYMENDFLENKNPTALVRCKDNLICPARTWTTLETWNKRAPHEDKVKHIPSSEPIFVLRAQDETAPSTVLIWAENYRLRVQVIDDAKTAHMTLAQYEKADGAFKDASVMRIWQRDNPDKVKMAD